MLPCGSGSSPRMPTSVGLVMRIVVQRSDEPSTQSWVFPQPASAASEPELPGQASGCVVLGHLDPGQGEEPIVMRGRPGAAGEAEGVTACADPVLHVFVRVAVGI